MSHNQSAAAAEKQRGTSYESSNAMADNITTRHSSKDVEKGEILPGYDAGDATNRPASSASVMVGRSDPFGDEANAEIKYKTMSWWHASMSKF